MRASAGRQQTRASTGQRQGELTSAHQLREMEQITTDTELTDRSMYRERSIYDVNVVSGWSNQSPWSHCPRHGGHRPATLSCCTGQLWWSTRKKSSLTPP
ncbi:hypothetical protein ElyMa_003008000 [Elysia marginata]|uniref:Uncharacterized protein n=1 Tax=Elysia marginata TaxID=1093978 RepID=A0AAV4ID08_9GAST|nr:hypothetical protein ElyMa_003008000 [Elysia marginata]